MLTNSNLKLKASPADFMADVNSFKLPPIPTKLYLVMDIHSKNVIVDQEDIPTESAASHLSHEFKPEYMTKPMPPATQKREPWQQEKCWSSPSTCKSHSIWCIPKFSNKLAGRKPLLSSFWIRVQGQARDTWLAENSNSFTARYFLQHPKKV